MAATSTPNLFSEGMTLPQNKSNATATEQFSYAHFIIYVCLVPAFFGLITLIGTIGNCLVIYVIVSRKRMRTTTNILLLNLAMADLNFVLICIPFSAYVFATQAITNIEPWPFGDLMCRLMHYLTNVTAYITVYILVLISVIRYMTIIYNTQTTRLRTKQNVVIMSVAVWITMLLVNVPITLSYQVTGKNGRRDCDLIENETGKKIYTTFFAFAYVLPMLTITVLSISILKHINKQRPSLVDKKKRKSNDKKKQATRLIILVVVIFGICWLPVHIHLMIAYFVMPSQAWYGYIGMLWSCLAYFNSCVNPIIYNFASKEFRDSFREVVCCARVITERRRSSAGTKYTNIAAHTLAVPNGNNGNAPSSNKPSTAKESSSDV